MSSNEIDVMVRALFARLLSTGKMYCEGQEQEDVIQEGVLGALEAVERWAPEHGKFSTHVLNAAHGHMLRYLDRESMGGIGSDWSGSTPLARYGELDTTDIDALTATPEAIGERQTYIDPPEGFDNPAVEADRASIISRLASLPPQERRLICALYGIGVPQQTAVAIEAETGISRREIGRRMHGILVHLGFRESAAPTGWETYREIAFLKGAGATKAGWPTGVRATAPIRKGHNNLFVEEEITPAQRRIAADVRRRTIG